MKYPKIPAIYPKQGHDQLAKINCMDECEFKELSLNG